MSLKCSNIKHHIFKNSSRIPSLTPQSQMRTIDIDVPTQHMSVHSNLTLRGAGCRTENGTNRAWSRTRPKAIVKDSVRVHRSLILRSISAPLLLSLANVDASLASLSSSAGRSSLSSKEPSLVSPSEALSQEQSTTLSQVVLNTLSDCELAVSIYPTFSYDAGGGGGIGTVQEGPNGLLHVRFDPSSLNIPPVSTSTSSILGIPLPPPLKISIEPKSVSLHVVSMHRRRSNKQDSTKWKRICEMRERDDDDDDDGMSYTKRSHIGANNYIKQHCGNTFNIIAQLNIFAAVRWNARSQYWQGRIDI